MSTPRLRQLAGVVVLAYNDPCQNLPGADMPPPGRLAWVTWAFVARGGGKRFVGRSPYLGGLFSRAVRVSLSTALLAGFASLVSFLLSQFEGCWSRGRIYRCSLPVGRSSSLTLWPFECGKGRWLGSRLFLNLISPVLGCSLVAIWPPSGRVNRPSRPPTSSRSEQAGALSLINLVPTPSRSSVSNEGSMVGPGRGHTLE